VAHARAKLTPFGRLLLVSRILEEGWPVAHAAEVQGVSRATAYKWLRRYRQEGLAGLEDRPSRPKRCPHALPPSRVRKILAARRRLRHGPHRLAPALGIPRSTVYAVLRRHGLSRLADADRSTGVPVRYVRDRPGELVHLDVKKLGKVPPGGGHRVTGDRTRRGRGIGYDYLHVAVDDHSRAAYVGVFSDELGTTTARFLLEAAAFYADHGVRIERVMTDQAKAYTNSRAFAEALGHLGARHLVTRPYRPQTNGKAERFIRTMLAEWAYARAYRTNADRLRALPAWVDFYNRRRPHTALDGQAPASRL
jgi:transposase InsO family protein